MRRSSRIRRIGAAILSSLVLVFLVSRGLAQHPADAAHPAEPAAQHAETAAPEQGEAHEAGPHDVHSMTPKEEMMAIL